MNTGQNLSLLGTLAYLALLTGSTFIVIQRRNHVVMHVVKNFYIALAAFFMLLGIVDFFNQFENFLFQFPTTASFTSYSWRYVTEFLISAFFVSVSFLMPALAGESLSHEVFPLSRRQSFCFFITSTFFSRQILPNVLCGYLTASILLGIQSLIFEVGMRWGGVWVEHGWLTQFSANYIPLLAVFSVALKASVVEEITFRIFAVSWFKKILPNLFFAVFAASVIWGFGHSLYLVFPMWFRGMEVTLMGCFLSFIFLRYGVIPIIVGHYLFDVVWGTADFWFGKTLPFYFYGSLFLLCLPLFYGITAYFINKPEKSGALQWRFNRHQVYNLRVLKTFLHSLPKTHRLNLHDELIAHGWDVAVVERAITEAVEEGQNEEFKNS